MSDVAEILRLHERAQRAEAEAKVAKLRLEKHERVVEALLPGFLASRARIVSYRAPLDDAVHLEIQLDAPRYRIRVPYEALAFTSYPSETVYRYIEAASREFVRDISSRLLGQLAATPEGKRLLAQGSER